MLILAHRLPRTTHITSSSNRQHRRRAKPGALAFVPGLSSVRHIVQAMMRGSDNTHAFNDNSHTHSIILVLAIGGLGVPYHTAFYIAHEDPTTLGSAQHLCWSPSVLIKAGMPSPHCPFALASQCHLDAHTSSSGPAIIGACLAYPAFRRSLGQSKFSSNTCAAIQHVVSDLVLLLTDPVHGAHLW